MPSTPCSHVWAPIELSYFTVALSAVLMIFAIAGNTLVCIAVYKDPFKKLRTSYMFWIVNLAVTDLTTGSITLPLSVVTHALEAKGIEEDIHTYFRTTYFISCTASILSMAAFSVDRFIAIKWQIRYRCLLRAKVCLIIAGAIWITSFSISFLHLVIGYINYLFIFAQVTFIIAIGISIFTFRLYRRLNHIDQIRRSLGNSQSVTPLRQSDRNITKLFLKILTLFLFCYAPAIVMMYILKFCLSCPCTTRHVLRDLQILFIMSNSAINPYVSTLRLKSFQRAVSDIFRWTIDLISKKN